MSKLTYAEAQQKVAEKYGYKSWLQMSEPTRQFKQDEAAELMAKSWANEAVREDRRLMTDKAFYDPDLDSHVVIADMCLIPLPYPEIL